MTIPPVVARAVGRVQQWPPLVRLLEILAAYGQAGGGLLAAGLAYSALFAALTGILFAVGLVGLLIQDPSTREAAVRAITNQVPPLAPIVRDGIAKVVEHAGAFSIIGLAGLGWSASQFYGAIDSAFARIFKRAPERGPVDRIVRGAVAVAIVVAAIGAGIVTSSIQALLTVDLPSGPAGDAARIAAAVGTPVITALLVMAAVALIFRLVPTTLVPWHSLAAPAVLAGTVIAAITEAFVFIAPRLVGALEVFGGFAAVFAAMTWLSWSFQALLIGAAWTSIRLPESPPPAGPQVEDLGPAAQSRVAASAQETEGSPPA